MIRDIVGELIAPYSDSPPVDVEYIAEKLGFSLVPISGLRELSSTDAYLSHRIKEIAYDSEVASVRIRFSIAHEMGHYYLHKEFIKDIRFVDYSEWKQYLNSIPGWYLGRIEYQAHEFAGQFLAPKSMIIECISDFKEEIEKASKIIPDDIEAIRSFIAVPLAKRFEMSQEAFNIRLIKENINPFDYI